MTAPWISLVDEVCVITGAGGGIGQSLARAFTEVGAKVALVDRDIAETGILMKELTQAGHHVTSHSCDVSDYDAVKHVESEIRGKLGACTILINNAGILRPGPLDSVSLSEWHQMFNVNLHGYFNTSRAFGEHMTKEQRGALVHVASIAGKNPQPYSGAYSTSKAAILMLSKQLAFEWGEKGIRSNTISPGMIRTPLSESYYTDPANRRAREQVVPLRRIADPDDVASLAVFLASKKASYINGQDIAVDGGFTQTLMSHIPRPGFERPVAEA